MALRFFRHVSCLLIGLYCCSTTLAQPRPKDLKDPVRTNVQVDVPINGEVKTGDRYKGGLVYRIGGKEQKVAMIVSMQNLPSQMVWADARKACDDLVLNGYDDWELPSDYEMQFWPSLVRNGIIPNLKDKQVWSATEYGSSSAWFYDFVTYSKQHGNKTYVMNVRCIRRSPIEIP